MVHSIASISELSGENDILQILHCFEFELQDQWFSNSEQAHSAFQNMSKYLKEQQNFKATHTLTQTDDDSEQAVAERE